MKDSTVPAFSLCKLLYGNIPWFGLSAPGSRLPPGVCTIKLLLITTSGTQGFHLGLVSRMILVFQGLLNEPCTGHPLSSGAAQHPPRHRLCPQAASCRPLSGKEAPKWGYRCDRAQVAPPHSPPPPRTSRTGQAGDCATPCSGASGPRKRPRKEGPQPPQAPPPPDLQTPGRRPRPAGQPASALPAGPAL